MLAEAGVKVLTGRDLQSVEKTGPRITGIVTGNGSYSARVFIDGSYEGDLMAAAGVSWAIGREGKAEFGESYAGKQYPKKTMNINGLDAAVTATDAGAEADGDDNIMTYADLKPRLLAQKQQLELPVETKQPEGSVTESKRYESKYQHVAKEYGLSPKVCLLPQSRGGLMWYNWAVENPEKVACTGGIYPVGDLTSDPGQRTCGDCGVL